MAALTAICLSACASGSEPPPSDLELYAASMLHGLHSHPRGEAGERIESAERRLARRRSSIRRWLVTRVGEERLAQLESDMEEEVHSVYWTRGPTQDEEWESIERAERSLSRLERRRRRAEGRN